MIFNKNFFKSENCLVYIHYNLAARNMFFLTLLSIGIQSFDIKINDLLRIYIHLTYIDLHTPKKTFLIRKPQIALVCKEISSIYGNDVTNGLAITNA